MKKPMVLMGLAGFTVLALASDSATCVAGNCESGQGTLMWRETQR